jgi:hypothetical protein
MTPEEKKQADADEAAGGYNEASEAYNLGLADKPPQRPSTPKPPPPKPKAPPVKKMASGGAVTRGDGCCTKGKTKGTMR